MVNLLNMKQLLIGIILFANQLFAYSQSADANAFKICNDKDIYAVDNFQLKNALGKIKEPKTAPQYDGGTLEIRRYFNRIQINPEKSQGKVFRSYISFIVTCEGQIGNYQILGNQPDSVRVLEEEILEKLKTMPNLWSTAEYKGEKVDCYQVLVFTVLNGTFSNIFYKE